MEMHLVLYDTRKAVEIFFEDTLDELFVRNTVPDFMLSREGPLYKELYRYNHKKSFREEI